MTRGVLIWAFAGVMVAGCWALYAVLTFPNPLSSAPAVAWTLINMSCPIAFVSIHFHFGIKLYWVLVANGTTYALFGIAVESLRQQLIHAK